MKPRIDKDLGITGEPERWVHSACILCSNGAEELVLPSDDSPAKP